MTFDQLYKKYVNALCYYSERIVKDKQAAEDIVTEVFIKVWKHKYKVDDDSMRAILYTSVKNKSFDFLTLQRRNRKRLNIVQTDIIPDIHHEETQLFYYQIEARLLADLMKNIELLPDKCKNVFILTFLKGWSTERISHALHISKQNVLNQKQRAVGLLRICLFNPINAPGMNRPWYVARKEYEPRSK